MTCVHKLTNHNANQFQPITAVHSQITTCEVKGYVTTVGDKLSVLAGFIANLTFTDSVNIDLCGWYSSNITCLFLLVLLNGKDYSDLIKLLNSELDKLSNWLSANKLSLNVKKNYYMVFHRAKVKLDKHAAIKMNGVFLQRTNSLKYLGVIIDHKLNWTQHIAHVRNKVSKGIGIMYRARNYLTKYSLKSLYFSYIYPYFDLLC